MRGLSQHCPYSGRDYPLLRRQTCLKKVERSIALVCICGVLAVASLFVGPRSGSLMGFLSYE